MYKSRKEEIASAVLAPAVGAGLKRANKSLHWIFTPLRSVKTRMRQGGTKTKKAFCN